MYTPDEIRQEVQNAVNTIKLEKDLKSEYCNYSSIHIFGYETVLYAHTKINYKTKQPVSETDMLAEAKSMYLNSDFYKSVHTPPTEPYPY